MVTSFIETHTVDTVLDMLIRERGFDRKLLEQRALMLWRDVVGPKAAGHTQPTVIAGGQLRVMVSDSVWLTELNFRKPQLIRKLNQRLGAEIVLDVIFRVGTLQDTADEAFEGQRSARRTGAGAIEEIPVEPEEEAYIEQTVAQVEDEELRETLRRIFTKQGQLSKLREQE